MFRHFDQDHSGTIDGSELQSALDKFGLKLPPHLVSLLVAKFGTSSPQRTKEIEPGIAFSNFVNTIASSPLASQVDEQTITFDRFIRACVFMKKFKKSFANLDRDKDGWVQLSYEQCLKLYLMLP
jgi:Ca2+-binding EF-hand superfamily protein